MKGKDNNNDDILDLNDLIDIEPSRGKFFQNLYELIDKRNKIINDINKTTKEKRILCSQLKIENEQHEPVDLEHLWFVILFIITIFILVFFFFL
jgi:hypothetical protein